MRAAAPLCAPGRTPETPARSCRSAAARSPRVATPSSRLARPARASESPSLRASEEGVDAAGSSLRLAHRLDDGRAAVYRIPGGEPVLARRLRRFWIDDDTPVFHQKPDPFEELATRLLADGLDRGVREKDELASRHGLGARPAARVRLAETHLHALDAGKPIFADKTNGTREPEEADAFLARLLDLVRVGGHLGRRAPVHEGPLRARRDGELPERRRPPYFRRRS